MKNKNNRGALFVNHKKEHEKQPDYTGNANIRGKETQISAWKNTSITGIEYLSLSFQDPQPKEENHVDSMKQKKEEEKVKANMWPADNKEADDLPF